jgi:hypothetical protein
VARVHEIFERYLALGTVPKLQTEMERRGLRTPLRISAGGRRAGGAVFSRGKLHHVLTNPVVIGRIRHGFYRTLRSSTPASGMRCRIGCPEIAMAAQAGPRPMRPARSPGKYSIPRASRCDRAMPARAIVATATM